ncbi:MAG: sugar phosphate isomerase/epimerase [Terracidiphilus sp.]
MSNSSRRTFLKASGAVAAAACAGVNPLAAKPLTQPLGLQLYSVRSLLPTQFDATLAKVRADGYTVVEAAGYYDRTAAEFRKAMDTAGLRCVSTHHALGVLETQLDQWIEYGQALGLEYFVCSSSGGMHRDPAAKGAPTLDDWHWIADEFNRIGERVKEAGMIFGVHNHTPEFAVIDSVTVYDELLRRTDPTMVVFEMDAGWVVASGHNPVDYLTKSPERFPLMHVKDMIRQPDGKELMTVLGRGSVDYAPIMSAATGLRYYFVEQEQFDMEPIEELRLDAEYMRKLRV